MMSRFSLHWQSKSLLDWLFFHQQESSCPHWPGSGSPWTWIWRKRTTSRTEIRCLMITRRCYRRDTQLMTDTAQPGGAGPTVCWCSSNTREISDPAQYRDSQSVPSNHYPLVVLLNSSPGKVIMWPEVSSQLGQKLCFSLVIWKCKYCR